MSISGKVIYGTYVSQAQIDSNLIRLSFIDFEDDLGDLEMFGFKQLPGEEIYYFGVSVAHIDTCTPMNINFLYERCVFDLTESSKNKINSLVNCLPLTLKNQLPPVGYYVIGEIMEVLKTNVSLSKRSTKNVSNLHRDTTQTQKIKYI